MTETEQALLAEMRKLRTAQEHTLTRVRSLQQGRAMRHGWLKLVVKNLETNPHTQYKVHLWGAVYWLLNFPAVTVLFFFAPALWLKLGIFITLIYSIYANFATDYGAMSAAMSAFGSESLPEIPMEVKPPA